MSQPVPRHPLIRWRRDQPPVHGDDAIAGEEPLEIRVAGRAISVTMRTPSDDPAHDEELALGFLVGEGVIAAASDVEQVGRCDGSGGNILDVRVASHVAVDFDALTRHVFASASCGLCGVATIEQVRKRFPAVGVGPRVATETLLGLVDTLRAAASAHLRPVG